MGGGITKAFADLLLAMGVTLPPWAMPAGALGLMVVLLPWILKNMRTSQAHRLLKRAALEGKAGREALEAQAQSLVRGNPEGTLSLAGACVQSGRYGLAQSLLLSLPAGDARLRREKQRLLEAMAPREPPTPEAALALIERFLEQGQREEAQVRLGRARQRWPEDAGLQALGERSGG